MGWPRLSSKARAGVGAALVLIVWLPFTVSAVFAFERHITLPYCREACLSTGDAFESYRGYTRGGLPEACLCQSGKQIRPDFLHNPIGVTLVALIVVPVVGVHVWTNVRAARAAAARGRQTAAVTKRRRG